MLADSPDTHATPWRLGDRLQTRGRTWTLTDVEVSRDCAALSLAPVPHGASLTLLSPFDRFDPATLRTPHALVSLADFARHVCDAVAASHPAGSLRRAAQTAIALHAYQLEPALAVFRHGHTRVLVADDVGLGKTVEAGVILSELIAERRATRALILVPAGLREQWQQELVRLFGIEATIADAGWLAAFNAEAPADANPWNIPGVFLASQDLIKRPEVLRPLEDVTWDVVVVDEAHGCSVGTDRRAAVHAISSRSRRVVLLTATPPEDPVDFAALCDIGTVPGEPPVALFRRTRADVGQGSPRSSRLMFVRPTEAEHRMHELLGKYAALVWRESRLRGDDLARLAVITLRKRALSSARSLAVSAARRLALLSGRDAQSQWQPRLPLDSDEYDNKDDEPEGALRAPGMADASRERRWLSAIIEVAHRAARLESKARWLRRFLRRIDEPAIVFTEYRDTLRRLEATLGPDRELLVLHGGMPAAERSRIQRLFNESPALLLATDAASEGLNLHRRCRLVIHYELPWSTMRLDQRAGRVDRLGQSRRVHEVALVARTDAERLVLGPLMQRAAKRASVINGAAKRARVINGAAKRASVPNGGSEGAGSRATGLTAALTESQVASLIFGEGAGLTAPPTSRSSSAPPQPSSFVQEAAREAQRLRCVRRLATSGTPDSVFEAVAARTRARGCRLHAGIVALYQLSFVDRAGKSWHSQVVPLHIELSLSRPLTKKMLERFVSELTHACDPRIVAALTVHVEPALRAASGVSRACVSGLQFRDEGTATVRASAARQLVQAALFETRAKSREARVSIPAMPGLGPTASTLLCIDTRLIGVLDVRRS